MYANIKLYKYKQKFDFTYATVIEGNYKLT